MPVPAPSAYHALAHDARAVQDAASLRLADYEPHGRPDWIVASITLGPKNGIGVTPGSYIDGATGHLYVPPGARPCFTVQGTWNAMISSPPGTHAASGSYLWYEPILQKRDPSADDHYWPVTVGGIMLFRPGPGKTDSEQFGDQRLIFPDWVANVATAFAFHEANPSLLDPGPQTAAVPQLVKLVSQENPFLAAVAFRNLLALGLAQPDYVRAQLARVSGPLGAVFGYLTMVIVGPNAARSFAEDALQVLDTASEPTIRALVLGAYTATLYANWGPTGRRAKPVVVKARQRLVAAGVAIEKDPRLALIFEFMGT